MKIDFANLSKAHQEYSDEIESAIKEVIRKSSFIMGEEIQALEEELADFVGCKYAITCSSGTSALLLSLLSLDIKPGDEIITSVFSFIAPAEMIAFLGAKPVFIDINARTFELDENLIQSAITPKTKAIIPVSLFGQTAQMDTINLIAQKYNLAVIEDAAQSFGASYRDRKSCNLSLLATTSFFPAKPLGCYGDGGAIFCNDNNLAQKIKSLRVHGQIKRYEHAHLGISARLDTMQAAILRVKLKYYPHQITRRNKVAKLYEKYLKNKSITLPLIQENTQSIYSQYCILSSCRQELQDTLNKAQIPHAIHYPKPLHLQECFAYLGYKKGEFENAEKISQEILSLPMNPYLQEEEIKYISKHIS